MFTAEERSHLSIALMKEYAAYEERRTEVRKNSSTWRILTRLMLRNLRLQEKVER
jgi:hypothetical protein